MPYCAAGLISTTTMEPAAPETMPGLPPNSAVTGPMINAVCKPTIGERPATSEKPTASGIIETATTKPAGTSFLTSAILTLLRLNMHYSLMTDGIISRVAGMGYRKGGRLQAGTAQGGVGRNTSGAFPVG